MILNMIYTNGVWVWVNEYYSQQYLKEKGIIQCAYEK